MAKRIGGNLLKGTPRFANKPYSYSSHYKDVKKIIKNKSFPSTIDDIIFRLISGDKTLIELNKNIEKNFVLCLALYENIFPENKESNRWGNDYKFYFTTEQTECVFWEILKYNFTSSSKKKFKDYLRNQQEFLETRNNYSKADRNRLKLAKQLGFYGTPYTLINWTWDRKKNRLKEYIQQRTMRLIKNLETYGVITRVAFSSLNDGPWSYEKTLLKISDKYVK